MCEGDRDECSYFALGFGFFIHDMFLFFEADSLSISLDMFYSIFYVLILFFPDFAKT